MAETRNGENIDIQASSHVAGVSLLLSDDDISLLFNLSFGYYYFIIRKSEEEPETYTSPLERLNFGIGERKDGLLFNSFLPSSAGASGDIRLPNNKEIYSRLRRGIDENVPLTIDSNNAHGEYSGHKSAVVEDLIKVFKIIASYVETNSYFSLNEEIDDIQTKNLRYIMTSFILGHLCCESSNLRLRKYRLKQAIVYMKQYVATLDNLRAVKNKDLYSFIGEDFDKCSNYMFKTASMNRSEKIRRAKYENEVDKKIEYLLEKKKISKGSEFSFGTGDENVERELLLEMIERFAFESLTHLELSTMELQLLESREERNEVDAGNYKKEMNHTSKLNFYSIRNFDDLRLMYRKMVFTPDYILPSVSLAECAAAEMELEVNILGKPKRDVIKDEETIELEQREWDNWKDDNPKGWGNKLANIG